MQQSKVGVNKEMKVDNFGHPEPRRVATAGWELKGCVE